MAVVLCNITERKVVEFSLKLISCLYELLDVNKVVYKIKQYKF